MSSQDATYLDGQLLVSMPGMSDTRFAETVILLCAHSDDGAMGLILNKVAADISFQSILSELAIQPPPDSPLAQPVHIGGPVEKGRGFVLHSADYSAGDAIEVPGDYRVTTSLSVLRDMAFGTGPTKARLALGYSGWGPGQLEREIRENGWLITDSDSNIVFDTPVDQVWQAAVAKIGIDPRLLATEGGNA